MPVESSAVVQRLWNNCNVLHDDEVSYGDYVEQVTHLLFQKMADEQQTVLGRSSAIPWGLDWNTLVSKDGDELKVQYRHILTSLGKEKGMLGVIFRKARNKIRDPAKLKRLINLINSETWVGMDMDVKPRPEKAGADWTSSSGRKRSCTRRSSSNSTECKRR